MSLLSDIRAVLEAQTITAAGMLPEPQRAFEDVLYTPDPHIPFVRSTFMPTQGRPFSVSGGTKMHMGIFQVDAVYPAAKGIAVAEQLAEAIKDAFAPGLRLRTGGDVVLIDYSERGPAMPDGGWQGVPVTIGWRCYSARN